MSGGATVVFWMLFRRASSGYPHRCLLLNDAPSQTTEGLRFHVKLDAVCVCHHPGETRLPYGRLGTLLSERGQGLALLGPASISRQNDQCWHCNGRAEHRDIRNPQRFT
mgnify:FL=1